MSDSKNISQILADRQQAVDAIEWDEVEQEYRVPAMEALISVPKSYLQDSAGQVRQILRLLEKGATPQTVLAFAIKAGLNT
ncbi:hypothetical protein [Achromobacter denitrificans]|uniref:hypothetical protein n=1 Tax=Achromobacter denitrificans TaxID=32002 RepID=UPI001054DF01|nr:hypothetical protein [Achromobacter denitrificans]QKH42433.1 hypothetical protein FOC82_13485 [Achromobacter denitrificans]QKH50424.1 hypothetical protein FOC80_13665 [Achromobacter denitrificans]